VASMWKVAEGKNLKAAVTDAKQRSGNPT